MNLCLSYSFPYLLVGCECRVDGKAEQISLIGSFDFTLLDLKLF